MLARLSRSAFICRPIDSTRSLGGLDVLDLDARALDAPGHGGVVDHPQQAVVDLVALGERLVEVHRAHDGADVGHRQVDDREAQVVDFIGGLGASSTW
jgi:hypothetical protein